MYCSVVGGTVETVIVIRVQPLCLYFDVVCCSHIWQWCTAFRTTIFTFQLLQHFVSRLCQQIVLHFASQLHGTNLEPLAFALATTIPCWAFPCWAIATESCDYKLFSFFSNFFSSSSSFPHNKKRASRTRPGNFG